MVRTFRKQIFLKEKDLENQVEINFDVTQTNV